MCTKQVLNKLVATNMCKLCCSWEIQTKGKAEGSLKPERTLTPRYPDCSFQNRLPDAFSLDKRPTPLKVEAATFQHTHPRPWALSSHPGAK